MDKLQWKELILQWVKGHEFVFIVSIEGVADDNDFILSLSKDDVLSLVIDRFKDTDIFEGVMNVPYNIDSEINSNLALLAGKYPGKYLEITLSTLENYLKSWKYLYENFDEEFFEDMRHCYYKYFHDSDYCYYELADLEGEFDIWPVVEGEGTVREIQYYVVDCLVALRLHVYDDMLLVHVGEHNLDGGVARKIEVKDMAKLKSILGVNNIEDVIDALMGKCQSIDSPLDKDMFYQFLKENGLEYDEQVKGEYVSYMDADENLYSVCRPIDSSIEQDSKDESVLEDEINTSLLTLPIVSYQEDTLRFVVRTPEGTEAIVPAVLFQQTQEFVNNLPESLECYVMKDGSIQQAKKQLLEQCFKKKKGHATFIVDTITDNKYQLLDFYGFSHPYESDISHQWKIGEEVEMIYDGIEACDEDNTAWLKIVEPYVLEVAIRTNAQMAYNDESLQLPLNLNAETYSLNTRVLHTSLNSG